MFFGTVWGAAEAVLGGMLHRAQVPYASVPLAIIALAVLTIARVCCPRAGSSTLIASWAMLFKFVNAPFWGCHLLGIFLLGAAYDLLMLATGRELRSGPAKVLKNALFGATAAYLGFGLFAVTITYVFRYEYWAREGLPRVLDHVFLSGTMAALGSAILVPLCVKLAESVQVGGLSPLASPTRWATRAISLVTLALWILAVTVSV
jgi:hypothetical protein